MNQSTFDFVRDNMAVTPFHQWLLPVLEAVDEAESSVKIRLDNRPELCRQVGRPDLHGGVIAALIDIAGHASVAAKVLHNVATIDMRVDYLRLAGGSYFNAVGKIVKLGRTIGVVDIEVTDDQSRLVAAGRAAYLASSI